MKRFRSLAVFCIWLLSVLACNLPLTAREVSQPDIPVTQPAPGPTARPGETAPPAAQSTRTPGLPVVTVEGTFLPPPTTEADPSGSSYQYITQPGDTLAALYLRFNVGPEQVLSSQPLPTDAILPAGIKLVIPRTEDLDIFSTLLMPDSEIVYSPAALDFSVQDTIQQAGGFLSTYSENVDGEKMTGAQIIQRVADETSINPRLLLAFLEYRSHWVYGKPEEVRSTLYPIGFSAGGYSGLLKELTLVARQLTIGYYGWRSGKGTRLTFLDRTQQKIHPTVNAGTAALQYLFAVLYYQDDWRLELYDPARFITFYRENFGDPWLRAESGPLLPDGLKQPELNLPFGPGEKWSFTGGPHAAWGVGSPWGGIDFAPANVEKGCTVTRFWGTAAAAGQVVRSEYGQVVLDLDGDGNEQTGWALLYLHIAPKDRVPVGAQVKPFDPIGHPSCEGGFSTGTHEHIARKYNGEWIAADGPIPFVLSGWRVSAGDRAYSGWLAKADQIVTSRIDGASTSLISQ